MERRLSLSGSCVDSRVLDFKKGLLLGLRQSRGSCSLRESSSFLSGYLKKSYLSFLSRSLEDPELKPLFNISDFSLGNFGKK